VDRQDLKVLDETKLAENTAVVVFGDHGEAWGEHKIYFHGQNLTEEQLRIPLIVTVPGHAPVISDDEVGLIDVGPTLLDLIGVTPPSNLHGRSLLPVIEGGALPPRPIFAELLPSTATPDHEVVMVDRGRKLVHKVSERRFELFDLGSDPKQMKNLADDPATRPCWKSSRPSCSPSRSTASPASRARPVAGPETTPPTKRSSTARG
jgi:choline-sulfatase